MSYPNHAPCPIKLAESTQREPRAERRSANCAMIPAIADSPVPFDRLNPRTRANLVHFCGECPTSRTAWWSGWIRNIGVRLDKLHELVALLAGSIFPIEANSGRSRRPLHLIGVDENSAGRQVLENIGEMLISAVEQMPARSLWLTGLVGSADVPGGARLRAAGRPCDASHNPLSRRHSHAAGIPPNRHRT